MNSATFRKALTEELGGDVHLPAHLPEYLVKKRIVTNVRQGLNGLYDFTEQHIEQARLYLIKPIFSKYRRLQ